MFSCPVRAIGPPGGRRPAASDRRQAGGGGGRLRMNQLFALAGQHLLAARRDSKNRTPPTATSVLRVFRSWRWTVSAAGWPGLGGWRLDREAGCRACRPAGRRSCAAAAACEDALIDVLEVDPDLGRSSAAPAAVVRLGLSPSSRLRRRRIALLLVALGRERRRQSLAGPPGRCSASPALLKLPTSGCSDGPESVDAVKYRYLPSLVEHRIGVAHAVGDLRRLAGLERVEVDRAEMVRQPRRIGEPLRVGRPDAAIQSSLNVLQYRSLSTWSACAARRRRTRSACANRRRRSSCSRATTAASGRSPARQRDLLDVAAAVLRREVQRVFAGFVGEVRDRLAVRRPRRDRAPSRPACWSDSGRRPSPPAR